MNLKKVSFLSVFQSRVVNTVISPIKLPDSAVGWVLVVDPVVQDDRNLHIQ